jgi:HEAT repeat protein
VAPREALGPLAEAAGKGERAERAAVRAALAKASRNAEPEALERLLSGAKEAKTKVELLRGLAARLPEVAQAEAWVTRELASPEMGTRYVLVEPARALGLAGKIAPLSSLLDDVDPYVRAHAAESSERIPTLAPKLTQKLADPDPRVREAALVSLATSKVTPERETMAVFANDEWTFVRVAAAGALAQLPPGRDAANPVDKALEGGLAERSPLVKQAALAALGQRHAKGSAAAIAEVAKDAEAPLEVRVTATRTLGAVCASSELEYLTRAANRALSPLDEADLRVGVAAIDALGRLHPADLATRLAKLREKGVRPPLVHAATRALAETDVCKVQ